MPGITNIDFLTRPISRYDNGGEVFNPNMATQDLGTLEEDPILLDQAMKEFNLGEYYKNLTKDADYKQLSEDVTDRAVGEASGAFGDYLKKKGYKITFDAKGFKNWLMGNNPDGSSKFTKTKDGGFKVPKDYAKKNRQQLSKILSYTPAGALKKFVVRQLMGITREVAPNLVKSITDYYNEDKPDYYTSRQDQQNKARQEAGIKAKEIFEQNLDKPFYSENPNIESIFDIISRETGYKSRNTIIKMLKEQNVDYTTAIKAGGFKPENFSDIVKESKGKTTKEYKDSITDQVLQIYEDNKNLPMTTGKENVPTIMEIMQQNVPSFQKEQKVSLKTIKEILQNEDVYEHTASGEPKAENLEVGTSKITGEKLTEFSPMFTRGVDLKEFPNIERLNEFFTSQGLDLKNLNQILSNNPEKFNELEATRVKVQKVLKDQTSDFNKALATQAENYDKNGNFMPIIIQKMHPNESLRPQDIESQFGSIDIENVRLGGSTVNTVVQPEHAKALQTYIKNKDVENTNRIINTLEEYHILTNLNNMLDKEDYQWLEQNKIIKIPKISYKGEEFPNTDAVMFGAKESPSIEQIIEAELKARKNFGLKYSVYQEMKGKGEKLPAFDTYLKDGGMVGISHLTRPLGNF